MKKILTLTKPVALILLAVLFITCGKKSSGDYRNLIPQNSVVTVSINAGSLLDKSGISDAERAAFKTQAQAMFMFMGGMFSADDQKLILSLIDDPDNSGLSFRDDMYLFVDGDNSPSMDDVNAGFVAKVKNRKKLENLFGIFTKMSPDLSFSNEGGISVLTIDRSPGNTAILALDDNACLIYRGTADYTTTIREVSAMFKGARESIVSDNRFSPFVGSRSDMGVLMSYEAIRKMAEVSSGVNPLPEAISGMHAYMNTEFKKGSIDTDYGLIFRDNESKKVYDDFNTAHKIDGKFADIIPRDVLAAFSGNLQGEAILTSLVKIPQYAFLSMIPEAKTILGSFSGDMVFAFTGLDIPNGEFTGMLAATVKDREVMDNLIEQYGGYLDMKPAGENTYRISIMDFPVTFGMHDNTLYFANDPVMIEALKGKSVDNPDNEILKHFKGGYGVFYININRLVGILLDVVTGGPYYDKSAAQALHFLSSFENLLIYAESPYEGKMIVKMVDKSENAVATITNFIKDMAMNSMGGGLPF